MCNRHYQRWRRNRTPGHASQCAVGPCASPTVARGFCSRHYQQWRRTGEPLGGIELGLAQFNSSAAKGLLDR